MFGKALGNGYAVTAVVGKEEIMQNAQSSLLVVLLSEGGLNSCFKDFRNNGENRVMENHYK